MASTQAGGYLSQRRSKLQQILASVEPSGTRCQGQIQSFPVLLGPAVRRRAQPCSLGSPALFDLPEVPRRPVGAVPRDSLSLMVESSALARWGRQPTMLWTPRAPAQPAER